MQLPEKEKRKMFAHAGILLAAQAILDDLKVCALQSLRFALLCSTAGAHGR